VLTLIIGSLFTGLDPTTQDARQVMSLSSLSTQTMAMMSTPQIGLVFQTKRWVSGMLEGGGGAHAKGGSISGERRGANTPAANQSLCRGQQGAAGAAPVATTHPFLFATARCRVFYKHRDNNFFPPFAYVLTLVLTQLPQSTLECTIYRQALQGAPLSLS
jgi:hypothetical protein